TDRRIDSRRILGYLETAMQSLTHALEYSADMLALALSVVPEREGRLRDSFNRTEVPYPGQGLVHLLFEEHVQRAPTAIAAICADRSITFEALNARANQLARCLRANGVIPEERVAICVDRGFDLLICMLAVLKAGAAYVPLDPSYPDRRLEFMLEDA